MQLEDSLEESRADKNLPAIRPGLPETQGKPASTPRSFSLLQRRIRSAILILNAKMRLWKVDQLGKNVKLSGRVRIRKTNGGQISLGDKVVLESLTGRTEFLVENGGKIEIGDHTFVNFGCIISANASVKIGKRCHIAHYVIISDYDFHGIEDRNVPAPPEPVVIGNNVWLADRVTVLKGVTIGYDSVVAAGSVVTKDIPPRSLAAGIPARVIRSW